MLFWKTLRSSAAVKRRITTSTMAKSKFEYVKSFEEDRRCIPNCWMVIKIDGKNFSKFTSSHGFEKPNDLSALQLMNRAATSVMQKIKEIVLGYGQSDEYSFIFQKDAELYNRRVNKLLTYVTTQFAASYMDQWKEYFKEKQISHEPSFAGTIFLFPSEENVRDYLCWRQADVHENNLYDTCVWNLVKNKEMTQIQAQEHLNGTSSSHEIELLLQKFKINYSGQPAIFREGATLVRKTAKDEMGKTTSSVATLTIDIMGDEFWEKHPGILREKKEAKAVIKTVEKKRSRSSTMAKTEFEDTEKFQIRDYYLPNSWVVVRIDGKNFSKFTDSHGFEKPNDFSGLQLMNRAGKTVMENFQEIVLGYGQSDEYSFIFKKGAELYNREVFKLITHVSSLFATSFVNHWDEYFSEKKLLYPPSFDARLVMYPSDKNMRDYLSWRQADVHVNNLYNTCFWNLVKKKDMSPAEAQEHLKGTLSSHKNELLFQDFGINYNNEPAIFRKGTTLVRKIAMDGSAVVATTDDIIGEKFWDEHPEILESPRDSLARFDIRAVDRGTTLEM